jgi:NAD(P)-dependent dehydrogenase (short-subunit alcohol dehydrogenase family)
MVGESVRSMAMIFRERFNGRRAIVTGGASGIGLRVAERLILEGARVSLWDVNRAGLESAMTSTGAAHIACLDIVDERAVHENAAAAAAALGGLDILVVSAGVSGPNVPVVDYAGDAWRRVIDINLNGAFYCNQAAARLMSKAGYGRIVNVASVAGKEGNPNASAYSASKAGLIALTKSLGKELANAGVTVNCIAPAAVRTPIFEQVSKEHIAFMLSKIPMGRFGEIDEIAALVCWMASAECSFSTGAVFDATGGRATY